jgi:signal transduction histidine kinase
VRAAGGGARCLGVLIGGAPAGRCRPARSANASCSPSAPRPPRAGNGDVERGHARRQLAHVAEEYREASRRVVHEVNNPLSIIKNYLSVLDSKLERQEPVVGELSILNEEIDRVGQLINSLADLQPRAETSRVTDVGRVVDDVLRLFRATDFVPANGRDRGAHAGEAGRIDGDADILKQILVNLIKNAIEALTDRRQASRSPTAATSTASASCIWNWWSATPVRACRAKCWPICSPP